MKINAPTKQPLFLLVLINFLLCVLCLGSACSGGGGEEGPGGRTRGTAIRIVHGAVEASPVTVKINGEEIQSAKYGDITDYKSVSSGTFDIIVERANSPGVIAHASHITLAKDTEYSVFITSAAQQSQLNVSVVTDVVQQPPPGFALIQVLNSFQASSRIRAEAGGQDLGNIGFGGTSGFVQVSSGVQTIIIRGQWGQELTRLTLTLADQSEITVAVSGSADLGVNYARVYNDLD